MIKISRTRFFFYNFVHFLIFECELNYFSIYSYCPGEKKSIFVWLMGKCIVFRIKGGNLKQIYIESSGNARIPKRIKTKRLPSYTYNTYTAIGQIKRFLSESEKHSRLISFIFVILRNGSRKTSENRPLQNRSLRKVVTSEIGRFGNESF